jgi:hypothetical protein
MKTGWKSGAAQRQVPRSWRAGTLVYGAGGLAALFLWMLKERTEMSFLRKRISRLRACMMATAA